MLHRQGRRSLTTFAQPRGPPMPDLDRPHSDASAGGTAPEPVRVDLTNPFSLPGPTSSVAVAAPPSPPRPHAGRYEIRDEIARGGVGVVYRAHDPAVNRHVAVKVLQERFRNNPVATSRFVEEGQITGQ